ncbi:MAG: thiol peroxidase [Flavobacteriales bacterium]|nr:thiol peroxidase [Flavobacteriales bacterium]
MPQPDGPMPQPRTLSALPGVGQTAPALRYVKQDKSNHELASLRGEVVVLVSLPSLDTSVCATETRTFNQKVAGLGAHVLVISMDLPFAMKRFCETEGITNVHTGSDFRYRDLATGWGAAIAEGPMEGLHCRAVWVIDRQGIIRHVELTPELGAEPDYEAVIAAARRLL